MGGNEADSARQTNKQLWIRIQRNNFRRNFNNEEVREADEGKALLISGQTIRLFSYGKIHLYRNGNL